MSAKLTPRQQLILFAKHTAQIIRLARAAYDYPTDLIQSAHERISVLWDYGCHSDNFSVQDKETMRRCVVALEKMFADLR